MNTENRQAALETSNDVADAKRKAKPIKKADMSTYLKESRGLERDLLTEIVRSRRRAWAVAGVAGLMGILGLGAGIAGLSQPSPEPLILRVDNATGAVDQVTAIRIHEASYGEVVDEYWINQFILNRESYDYNTIQQNYETTALLSSPTVQQEYYKLYEGPGAIDSVLSNKARIKVSIKSIQPNNRGQASVRFTTTEVRENGSAPITKDWIATVGYNYVQAPMSRIDRRINPLGFQVTSYRADPEQVR